MVILSPDPHSDSYEHLKQDRDRFVLFAFAAADILVEVDEEGKIFFMDGATSLLGHTSDELKLLNFFDLVAPQDQLRSRTILKKTNEAVRLENIQLRLKSPMKQGSLPFQIAGFKLSNAKRHYYLTLALAKANLMDTPNAAARDVETGMLRKENFAEAATEKLRAASESGQNLQLTLVDLPQLRELLDRLPRDQADALMQEISSYLRSTSADGDTAGALSTHAFSLVHDTTVSAQKMMDDLVLITKQADPKGVGVKVHIETMKPDYTALGTQDAAVAMLYTLNKFADERGKDFNINSINEGYQDALKQTVEKINNFKQTVAEGNFMVAFQPIVDLRSGMIHHFESLVRLPQGSPFSNPFDFITFGEEAGLIHTFDLAMLEKSLGVLKNMAKEGHRPNVAVNLSGKSLSSTSFMDSIRQTMDNNADTRKQIIFEITESAKIADMKVANDFIQEMRRNGNPCCLDDFGVGESGFDYLRSLQVDYIKVDGSYVRNSLSTPGGRKMLKAMIGVCRELGINTIGEMVEDEKVASILWDSGVQLGQGYLFGKPETNVVTLANPHRTTENYKGITRNRRFSTANQKWWKRPE